MEAYFGCKEDDGKSSSSSSSAGGGGGCSRQITSGREESSGGFSPENSPGAPLLPAFSRADHPTFGTGRLSLAAASTRAAAAPSAKRSTRRSMQKRVVSVPMAEADGSRAKGTGEGAPPSDSWTWRKYGQKPIKGSPYPRGYYRCSSSKGCPARKQVERSRVDPNMLVITYACEHNHPWPLPKTNHSHQQHQQRLQLSAPAATRSPPASPPPEQETSGTSTVTLPLVSSPPASAGPVTNSFAIDLLVEDSSLVMMADEFGWFADVSASSPPLLGSPMMPAVMEEDVEVGGADTGDDDSSLFAGLGELPECAMVFRSVRMQVSPPEDRRAVAPRRTVVAAPPCCGTTG